jgi:UbiD family decarboxylase
MKDVREWMAAVEAEGDLKRITAEVDWELELGHIATLNERQQGPALLFENVKGYKVPVLASTCSTPKRMAITCGRPSHYSLCEVAKDWKTIHEEGRHVDPVVLEGVPSIYEVLEGDDINLWEIPVPRMYPQDGGRYFGLATCFVTEDPETGWTNLGTYRAQVLDEKTLGCNIWIGTKHGKHHIDKYLKAGKTKMPIAIYCGCDIFHFVAGSARVPDQQDEYGVIGAMMGEAVEVFKSDLTGLKLPAHAEYILEGELDLDQANWRPEGPLGEYVGYYGASGAGTPKPPMNVTRMYRRRDPIFVVTTVGRPIGDTHLINTITLTAALWADLETMKVPGVKSVYVPPEAAGRFWAIVSAKIAFPGHAQRILEACVVVVGLPLQPRTRYPDDQ